MGKLNLSEAKIGDTFPPVSYIVTSEIAKRYAEVNGVSQPVSASSTYVSPGMLAHDIVWIASKYFDITGVLLAGLELEFEGLMSDSGTVNVCESKIEDISFHGGDQYTIASFVITNEDGKAICRSKITCVSKTAKAKEV
ncbi:MAG: hypothetical protein FJ008_05515 [Chloroflexi bacterium]|nr:hypothetical protein [Chloroflexota bacterium]MBM3174939.1 hypothetical protein [Chloroflexota bacterium]